MKFIKLLIPLLTIATLTNGQVKTKLYLPTQQKKQFKRNYIDEVLADGCITKRKLTKEEIAIHSDFHYIHFIVDAAAEPPHDAPNKPLLKYLLFSDQGGSILLERYQKAYNRLYGIIERPGLYYAMLVSESCTSIVQFKVQSLDPMVCEEAILYDCCQQPSFDLY